MIDFLAGVTAGGFAVSTLYNVLTVRRLERREAELEARK